MGHRGITYIIFDGDNDMWAYAFMKGWKKNENVDFDFRDAHDLNVITDRASEDTVKRKLKERFADADQVIVLIGEHTMNLYRFVRWEMEVALTLGLPIIAVNLNKTTQYDAALCPPILRDEYVVHVSYKMKIIRHALDNFPNEFRSRESTDGGNRSYGDHIYQQLGILD